MSEEKVKGEFTVNNPNFNYTEKSLSTSFFAINTDKMEESGYDSSEVGFSFGTVNLNNMIIYFLIHFLKLLLKN